MTSIGIVCISLIGAVGSPPAVRTVAFRAPVSTLTALPGETVALEAMNRRWTWTAPQRAGLYPIRVVSDDRRDSLTIQAFVLVPFSRLRGEYLNGYRIGRY